MIGAAARFEIGCDNREWVCCHCLLCRDRGAINGHHWRHHGDTACDQMVEVSNAHFGTWAPLTRRMPLPTIAASMCYAKSVRLLGRSACTAHDRGPSPQGQLDAASEQCNRLIRAGLEDAVALLVRAARLPIRQCSAFGEIGPKSSKALHSSQGFVWCGITFLLACGLVQRDRIRSGPLTTP